ncbi:MAG: hypothetical protein H6R26_208 [Proteobacteria bacterium]|nr:hypothetical protein [Pseudomonadota bacterium]
MTNRIRSLSDLAVTWDGVVYYIGMAPTRRRFSRDSRIAPRSLLLHTFTTVEGIAHHQELIKNSIFIAYAGRADDARQAAEFLHAILTRHQDASHLCWAYKISGQYRFSDGGEPGGTAGQPILRAIEGQNLDHVVVGVIRYFGGTKLGTGGLARAYGGTAAEALRQAEKRLESPRVELIIEVAFEHMGAVYRLLDSVAAERGDENYSDSGLRIRAKVPSSAVEKLGSALRDATRGEFGMTRVGA